MRIKNNTKAKIKWRAFKADDTGYGIGLHEDEVDPDKVSSCRDDSFEEIKVEIKIPEGLILDLGFLGAKAEVDLPLVQAGQKFQMTDDLIYNGGKLDVAEVDLQKSELVSERRTDIQFFDAREFNAVTTREVTFAIENAFSVSRGFQRSNSHEQTWSVGGKVGGELGEKDLGKGSAEISAQFQDKVVNSLQNSYLEQVSKVWKQSISDKFTFEPEKIYAIEVTWDVQLEKGVVSYFDEQTSYSVVASAKGSLTTPSAYSSVEEMPERLKKQYNAFIGK